jgi:hypothetical protein|uniref:Uncharacterized protein n=1 Tax=viral metagenome TaxID=1070528 RepID=A0A6C0DVB5_9ZZZZ
MPILRMNLFTQNQLANIQNQYIAQQQGQTSNLIRLGATQNRNFLPLVLQGNKSCKTCGGK